MDSVLFSYSVFGLIGGDPKMALFFSNFKIIMEMKSIVRLYNLSRPKNFVLFVPQNRGVIIL